MARLQLGLRDARRLAVIAQRLTADRPREIVGLVEDLTLLQIDPTAAIAPSADLVAWSRIGSGYRPADLVAALAERRLFEQRAFIRPMAVVGLYADTPTPYTAQPSVQAWIAANDGFRRDVLAALRTGGPLLSRDLPDTAQVPWGSSGWTDNRNVTQLLEFLSVRGEVAVAGRVGRQRLWDLAERVYPAYVTPPAEELAARLDAWRLRPLGIARERTRVLPGEPVAVGTAGVQAEVDGVRGVWRVQPELLDQTFTGRTALLSPFDRLVHDRVRTQELFGFEYLLEMYKPAAKRRWGYFALPILHGDQLVGKLDAKAEHRAGTLVVHAVHEDITFTAAIRRGVEEQIEALAGWLGLTVERR